MKCRKRLQKCINKPNESSSTVSAVIIYHAGKMNDGAGDEVNKGALNLYELDGIICEYQTCFITYIHEINIPIYQYKFIYSIYLTCSERRSSD